MVGQRGHFARQSPGLVAEQPSRTPAQQVTRLVEGGLAVTVGGEHAQARRLRGRDSRGHVGLDREGQVEQAAHTRPDGLGVVGVDAAAGEHDAIGAGRIGGADHRAGVAGVADVGADGEQAGVHERGNRDVQEVADRDDAGRGDGVGERRQGAVVDDGPGPGGLTPRGVPLGGLTGGEHLGHAALDLEGGLDGLRAVGKEEPTLGSDRAAAELPRLLDAGVPGSQGRRRSGQAETLSSRGALTSSGSAALAVSTRTTNAAMSLTARSARILRSTSTPARCRPWMKRL